MISILDRLSRLRPVLLSVLVVCLLPATLKAETVMFRNECRSPVVLQTVTVVRGVLRRDPPYLLKYGETTPALKLDADKVVSIYDGKGTRILFRDVLKASKKPLYYSIVYDPRRPNQVQVIYRPTKPAALPGAP